MADKFTITARDTKKNSAEIAGLPATEAQEIEIASAKGGTYTPSTGVVPTLQVKLLDDPTDESDGKTGYFVKFVNGKRATIKIAGAPVNVEVGDTVVFTNFLYDVTDRGTVWFKAEAVTKVK